MFVTDAHSTTQQSRLAITLAWIAGYTNAITLLTCHTATSHVSGTTSNLGIEIVSHEWKLAGISLFLLMAFLTGAALAGVATEVGRCLRWKSVYVLPIALQAMLLLGFALFVEFNSELALQQGWPFFSAVGCASLAMGLQNATITRISSGIVRTTHVTGVLTDLGLETVVYLFSRFDTSHRLGGTITPTKGRLLLLGSIVTSFAFGAGLGTSGYEAFPRFAMFPPVLFLLWIILQDMQKPIAEISLSTGAGHEMSEQQSSDFTIFRLTPDRKRRGMHQRIPNLAAWSSMLAPSVKSVILDLSEITSIDENSLHELAKVGKRMKDQGRNLVIAGHKMNSSDTTLLSLACFPTVSEAIAAYSNR